MTGLPITPASAAEMSARVRKLTMEAGQCEIEPLPTKIVKAYRATHFFCQMRDGIDVRCPICTKADELLGN
jgi:hypothetical protein